MGHSCNIVEACETVKWPTSIPVMGKRAVNSKQNLLQNHNFMCNY
jgi:hypothetical protein